MRHLFVINPRAFGRSQASLDAFAGQVRQAFADKGGATVCVEEFARHGFLCIQEALASMPSRQTLRVYACGDSEASYSCLNAIMGAPNAELAIVPFGMGNDFVRAFGKAAIAKFQDLEAQAHAPAFPVDVLRVNQNYALNFVTLGNEAKCIGALRKSYALFGRNPLLLKLADVWAGCAGLLSAQANQHYRIELDDSGVVDGRYISINCANGPCVGMGKNIVTEAVPFDGSLDMVATRRVSYFKTFYYMKSFAQGNHAKLPICSYYPFKKARIESELPMLLCADGEMFQERQVEIEVMRNAVKFVCAAPFPARFGYV